MTRQATTHTNVTLDNTVLNVVLPALVRRLHATSTRLR